MKMGQQKAEPTTRKSGKLFGYARVSTTDQDFGLQREALESAGVNTIFEEKTTGTKRDGRTELQKVLSVLGEGDALVVTRLDRLGRSMRDLANIAHDVRRERQLEGIAMAKRQGVYKGGKARLDRPRVQELSSQGLGPAAIARELEMARSSVYRLLEQAGSSRATRIGPERRRAA
jgi:DNA invertase Pin-like site-specific DNA recombinase